MNKNEEKLNLSRRGFIGKTAAAGIAAGTGLGLTTGTANAAKRGGILRLGSNGASTTMTFDATGSGSNWAFLIWNTVFNRLTYLNSKNELEPELATDWESSKDGMTWTVNLRKGVKFHDGSEFTADDAVWSLMRHLAPGSKSGATGMMGAWKDVVKTGKYQIQINMKNPDADTPYVMDQDRLPMVKKGTTDWIKPVGTGAYQITEHEPGVRMKAKRFEGHWKDNVGWFDGVEYVAINDNTSRINALLSGAVDVIREVPFDLAKKVESHPRYNVVRCDVGQFFCNEMHSKMGITKDTNVRKALKYATDRQAIIDIALGGYGTLGNDHPIHSSHALFDPSQPQRQFDTDKAKYYWKKSGLGNTVVEYNTTEGMYAGALQHAQILQQSAQAAGINFKINKRPADGYWSDVWGKHPYVSSYWGARPTAATTIANAFAGFSPKNKLGWGDERADKLLREVQKSNDLALRKEMMSEIQRTISDEGTWCIPVFFAVLDASSTKVKGLDSHGQFGLNGYRISERAWFA